MVCAGTEGWTASTTVVLTARVTGSKDSAGIVGDFSVQRRIDHIAGRSDQDGVTIGCCECGSAHNDIAAGAIDVFDVELLS